MSVTAQANDVVDESQVFVWEIFPAAGVDSPVVLPTLVGPTSLIFLARHSDFPSALRSEAFHGLYLLAIPAKSGSVAIALQACSNTDSDFSSAFDFFHFGFTQSSHKSTAVGKAMNDTNANLPYSSLPFLALAPSNGTHRTSLTVSVLLSTTPNPKPFKSIFSRDQMQRKPDRLLLGSVDRLTHMVTSES